MTTATQGMLRRISDEASQLPPESLADLAKYVDFLKFKAQRQEAPSADTDDLRIVNMRGLLEGVDVSPEALAAARREMWQKLDSLEL